MVGFLFEFFKDNLTQSQSTNFLEYILKSEQNQSLSKNVQLFEQKIVPNSVPYWNDIREIRRRKGFITLSSTRYLYVEKEPEVSWVTTSSCIRYSLELFVIQISTKIELMVDHELNETFWKIIFLTFFIVAYSVQGM